MLEMIQILDESALLWIQDAVRVPFLDPLVEAFTSLGNTGVMWIVPPLGMLCWKPTRRAGDRPVGYGAGDAVYQCGLEAARAPSPPLA